MRAARSPWCPRSPLLEECNTRYAQGGIVAAGEGDSPELLAQDITVAGDGINCREAVELLAAEGPALVDELLVRPARRALHAGQRTGSLARTQEAAHSVRRIYYSKDTTGQAIETSLAGGGEEPPADPALPLPRGHRPHHQHAQLHGLRRSATAGRA